MGYGIVTFPGPTSFRRSHQKNAMRDRIRRGSNKSLSLLEKLVKWNLSLSERSALVSQARCPV
jgi:hypothetical protein